MAASLVATQLGIPPQSHQLVRRDRLVATLEQDVSRSRLTLLSAPAGYGKTTVLVQWAHASRLAIAWLSLSEQENDPERFLRYLLTAWQGVQPDVAESPLGLLLGSMAPEPNAVLTAFLNAGYAAPEHTAFVLDDYHLIGDDSVHQALTYLLDHLPPRLHFVLAGRAEPPLPVARYRARQELLELRADELQFTQEETAEFLSRLMGFDLSDNQVAAVETRFEGWIAGLQLLALSFRRQQAEIGPFVVSGRQRFIADYLNQDVLAQQPDELRRFLLETSILDHLSGALCDTITGRDDSEAMLERLEREQLFLVPLDDRREWYRYHRLFADFLQAELHRRQPTTVVDLHRRAAGWLLAHDLPESAFEHAVAGDDPECVLQIFERFVFVKLWSGEIRLLQQWLDALPTAWYSAYPILGLARTGPLVAIGDINGCLACLDEVDQRLLALQHEDLPRQRARVTAIRCAIACALGDLDQAESYADQALRHLGPEDLSFQAEIYHSLGETCRGVGRWEDARAYYLKELSLVQEPAYRIRSAHVFGALADLDLRQGHLREAGEHWRKALGAVQERETWGRLPLPVTGWVYVRMGELLYEWNQLPEAWDHLSRGLARAELGGDVRSLIAGYLLAGRLALTEGDVATAAMYLEQARPLVEEASSPEWTGRFELRQLELWLAQDRLRAAVQWADQQLHYAGLAEQRLPDATQLTLARVLIVTGDRQSVERALARLTRLLQEARAAGRMGVEIEALTLQALASWQRGDRPAAMRALERALRLAEPEGYIRLFADLGRPLALLLHEARARAVLPEYVDTLLTAAHGGHAAPAPPRPALPEPLTAREQEVLQRLAAGLTNREIAADLSISPETVKKHTSSIYSKLAVQDRRTAVARARALALLG